MDKGIASLLRPRPNHTLACTARSTPKHAVLIVIRVEDGVLQELGRAGEGSDTRLDRGRQGYGRERSGVTAVEHLIESLGGIHSGRRRGESYQDVQSRGPEGPANQIFLLDLPHLEESVNVGH